MKLHGRWWRIVGPLGIGVLSAASGCRSGPPVAGDLAIVGVTVIDGTDGPALPNQTVVVVGDRIAAIRPAGEVTPRAKVVIDGRGKFLVPGLWDMHVHLFGYNEHAFPLFLANGVTTIRDLSDPLATSLWLRQETRFGRLLGPEMLISGPTLDSPYLVKAVQGTPYAMAREAIADSASAVAMVDSLKRVGVDHIKVHGMTPRAAYFAVLAEAKRQDIPVVGHVPDSVSLAEAIEAGQRTIEHDSGLELALSGREEGIRGWMLAGMQRAIDQNRGAPKVWPVVQYRLAAADSAFRSIDQGKARVLAELAATHDVWFDPTLVVLQAFAQINEPGIRNPPEGKYIPDAARSMTEGFEPKPNPTPADIAEGRRKMLDAMAPLRPLLKAGVKFITGTDVPVYPLVPGFSLHRELGLFAMAGFSPKQALQAATRNSAAAAGMLAVVGTIEAGKRASLVLLDADPLADVSNLRQIRGVVSRGHWLDRATLDRMLADAAAFARHR